MANLAMLESGLPIITISGTPKCLIIDEQSQNRKENFIFVVPGVLIFFGMKVDA